LIIFSLLFIRYVNSSYFQRKGLITESEYKEIVKKHTAHGIAAGGDVDAEETDPIVRLAMGIFERGEKVDTSGRCTMLKGAHGSGPISGCAMITNLRLLFAADDVTSASLTASGAALIKIKILPQAESVPLHSIFRYSFSRSGGSASRAPGWILKLAGKHGRSLKLLLEDGDSRLYEVGPQASKSL
jgi:hypothetical protein